MNSEGDFVTQMPPWKQGFGLQTPGAVRRAKGVEWEGRARAQRANQIHLLMSRKSNSQSLKSKLVMGASVISSSG